MKLTLARLKRSWDLADDALERTGFCHSCPFASTNVPSRPGSPYLPFRVRLHKLFYFYKAGGSQRFHAG